MSLIFRDFLQAKPKKGTPKQFRKVPPVVFPFNPQAKLLAGDQVGWSGGPAFFCVSPRVQPKKDEWHTSRSFPDATPWDLRGGACRREGGDPGSRPR